MGWWSYRPYVPVAQRREQAALRARKMAKDGRSLAPVITNGRTIASTFWGKAWCDHLESYSDFENRLPRGRTYARNGSVVDLQIEPGKISALVSGSHLYRTTITIQPLPVARWKAVQSECRGQIGSLIELLQARMSKQVMEIVTHRDKGLFPAPREIQMDCSCLDWAVMCKHVAAVLYGVGNRLDQQPDLLFRLRQVDHLELIAGIADSAAVVRKPTGKKTLDRQDLAQVFGIEMDTPASTEKPAPTEKPARPARQATTTKLDRLARTKRPAKRIAPAVPPPGKKAKTATAIKPTRKPKTSSTAKPDNPSAQAKPASTAKRGKPVKPLAKSKRKRS